MATRRRSSATKSTNPTVNKSSESVTKVTTTPRKRATKATRSAKSVETPVIETPKTEEAKVITKTWIEKVKEIDGFDFAILPFLYLEGFVKLILKQQLV